jgi:hypothetical protein
MEFECALSVTCPVQDNVNRGQAPIYSRCRRGQFPPRTRLPIAAKPGADYVSAAALAERQGNRLQDRAFAIDRDDGRTGLRSYAVGGERE